MSSFFWASDHLGWGVFAIVVFTGAWWLLADLGWRLTSIRIIKLAVFAAGGWLACVALIVTGFYLGGS
jgi:hypothetical protein